MASDVPPEVLQVRAWQRDVETHVDKLLEMLQRPSTTLEDITEALKAFSQITEETAHYKRLLNAKQ